MTLNTIYEASGMTLGEFSRALGIDLRSLERMLNGKKEVYADVLGNAVQIEQDMVMCEALFKSWDYRPSVEVISRAYKNVLDSIEPEA